MSKRFLVTTLLAGTGICLFGLALITGPSRSVAEKLPVALLGFGGAQNTTSEIIDINPDHAGFSAQPLVDIGDCPPPCPSGGSGGRVNGLAAVPGDPMTYFAASEVGGLFKSSDGGSSWAHLDGHLPTRTWDVAAARGGHRIYATSFYDWRVQSQSGIQVSDDGGATWSRPPIALPVTCAPARAAEPSAFGIALRPDAPDEVLVGTNCGMARSTDAGVTWTQFDPTPHDATNSVWDVVALPGGLTYACGDDGLLTSSDGQTWTSLGKPPNFPGGYCSLAVSPDEPFVVFVVFAQPTFGDYFVPRGGVFYEYDGDVSGNKWTALPSPDSPIAEPKRSPIVRTNDRSQGFDLWLGAGNLLRAHCDTPATPGARCPTVLLSPPDKWSGGFTDVFGDLTKAHGDSGDLAFDPTASIDACPTLYSSDGGIYRNEPLSGTDCHASARFMPVNVGLHALLLLGMEGVHRSGIFEEEIYLALQDNGLFYTNDAGSNSPTWKQGVGGDVNDVVADALRVVTHSPLMAGDPGFTNMHFARAPGWDSCVAHGTMEVIDQVPDPSAPGQYVIAIGTYDPTTCTIPKGVRLTNSIDSDPFGSALGIWTSAAPPCHVRASIGSRGLEVFVQAGACDWSNPDELWKYADGNWTPITPVGTGIATFSVDPVNPRRLYAATVGGGNCEMLRSDTGGISWVVDEQLTNLMHGFGAFVRQAQDNGDGVTYAYVQATLIAFDPENPNILVAGGRESGVFVSSDGGESWARITDPFTPGRSHLAHLPRPFFAHFDHEPTGRTSVYIGTAGRGVWRIDFANADLSVTKADSSDPVTVGNNLTYTVTVTNNGPDSAQSVTVADKLPAATTFVSCSSTGGGVCSGSGNDRAVTFASLGSGESETITFVATVNCSVADATVIGNTARVSSSALDPNITNNSATATTTASNPRPKTTGVSVDKPVLWPPNHKLVNVTVNYKVTDNCPLPANSCTLTVTSNEPINGKGDGNTSPDWIVLDAHHVQLRAERSGKGNGRIYTIGITCVDSDGSSSHKQVEVTVSHDQGKH